MIIKKINLKNKNDLEYLRLLRNKPYVRKQSTNMKSISKKKHDKWIINLKKNKIFLIKYKHKNIGYIRINEKKYVSWALEKKYWGKINFYQALKKVTKKKQYAIIKYDNTASQIIALKSGFRFYKLKNKSVFLEKK